jgi:hypothetical protein
LKAQKQLLTVLVPLLDLTDDFVSVFETETSPESEDLPVLFDVLIDTVLLPLEPPRLSVTDPSTAPVFLTVVEISFDLSLA